MAQWRQDLFQITRFLLQWARQCNNLHSIPLITRSPKLILWAIMVEVLGAYEETYKTYLHPINDLEQEGPWKLPPLSLKIDTLIRTTGREIGLFLGRPTTDIVTGRTTITVEVVIVNRSKHQHHALGFNSSSITLTRRARNPPGSISHMP